MADNPKAFISYASEDEARFVRPFAERLIARGVDIWVEFWDTLAGDNLVSTIFDKGLKPSDAVIVVLSKFSVDKPWVREELNYAKVRQIEQKVRLIPVQIEPCDVPECVRTTLWVEISDLNNYERQFERIVNSIYGQYEKPPLGPKPAWVRADVLTMDGLTQIDSIIFEHACRMAIEQCHAGVISGKQLVSVLEAQGISEAQIMETQAILDGCSFIEPLLVIGPPSAYDFAITTHGFEQFAQVGIPDYGTIVMSVARVLSQKVSSTKGQDSNAIASDVGQAVFLVEHILKVMMLRGWIECDGQQDGDICVHWVSPELRRKFEGNK
jgi:hypothetical protein